MWTEILITDVTQMSEDRVCIAGINHKGQNIRPDLPTGLYVRHLTLPNTAFVIRPRAVLKMYLTPSENPVPPHTEDHLWHIERGTEFLRLTDETKWYQSLALISCLKIADIFGTEIHRKRNIKPGEGTHSLGTVKPKFIDEFRFTQLRLSDGTSKLGYRLSFTDSVGVCYEDISVTDLALRRHVEQLRRQRQSFERISETLTKQFQNVAVWLRIGLAREYHGWCWLQVNGIYTAPDYLNGKCFADYPALSS